MSSKPRHQSANPQARRPATERDVGLASGAAVTRPASPVRLIAVVIVGFGLLWLVLSNSLVAYLSDAAPEALASVGMMSPLAREQLADRSLAKKIIAFRARKSPAGAKTGADPVVDPGAEPEVLASGQDAILSDEDIRAYAEQALAANPLSATALRIMGQQAILAGDKVEATRLMAAAARRNSHEYRAYSWLLQDSFERGDKAAAANYADTLLMTNSTTRPQVVEVLTRLAEDQAGRAELVRLLADNPRWRSTVLGLMSARSTDARTVFMVLQGLKDTPNPPTFKDVSSYLGFLTSHKFYDFAYYVWLQFLPPDRLGQLGLLNNGNFETPLEGGPFDWTLTQGSGSTVKVEDTQTSEGLALYVEFGLGRVNFGGVKQTLVLGPGRYKFRGKYRGEMRAVRGLEWRVVCLAKPSVPLSASDMFTKAAPTWSPFEFGFEVPQSDCVGQQVSLVLNARLQSERILSGSLWFDDLQIEAVHAEAVTESAAAASPAPPVNP